MNQSAQIQPWKLNSAVVEHMATCADAGISAEPPNSRANFYPEGAMMFNGGQSAGYDGRQGQLLYDTEKRKKQGEVRDISEEETSTN